MREGPSPARAACLVRIRWHLLGVCPLNGRLEAITAWLYRHRGTTAAPFALLAVIDARPTATSIVSGGALILFGEALRLWAASFIGPHSRGTTLRAPRLVTEGPYALMRHPLYAGNGIVCAGLLVFSGAFQPWLPLVFIPAFLVQYALFMAREERFLAAEWGSAWTEYRSRVFPLRVGGFSLSNVGPRFQITRDGWNLEWPTVRTVGGLILLCLISGYLK